MSKYYLFFILPIIAIMSWNIGIPIAAEDKGFSMRKPLKIVLLIFPWNEDVTYAHIVSNIVNEIIIILSFLLEEKIKLDLFNNAFWLSQWFVFNEILLVAFIIKYAKQPSTLKNNIRDLISIQKKNGICTSRNNAYSYKYEYMYIRNNIGKTIIIVPDSIGHTDLNGIMNYSQTKDKYCVASFKDLSEELVLRGIGVIKLEQCSGRTDNMNNSSDFINILKNILKDIEYEGKTYLLFHKDNNRLLFDLSFADFVDGVITSCNSYIQNSEERIAKLNELIRIKKVMCIDPRYNPAMKKSYRKKLSKINSDNYTYRYYPKMDNTFSKPNPNTWDGGVDWIGRKIDDYTQPRSISIDLCNDIYNWISE